MLVVNLRRRLHVIRNNFFARSWIICRSCAFFVAESSSELLLLLLLLNGKSLIICELVVVEICSATAWLESHVWMTVRHRIQILKINSLVSILAQLPALRFISDLNMLIILEIDTVDSSTEILSSILLLYKIVLEGRPVFISGLYFLRIMVLTGKH